MCYSISQFSITFTTFSSYYFFFNDTATTEIYTLSLHDALPIFGPADRSVDDDRHVVGERCWKRLLQELGRPAGFRGLAPTAPEREHLLNVAGPRPEQQREGRPCHDDPPTPANDGCRG